MRAPLALELRELEQAARSVQYLVDAGTLDAAVAEQVYSRIEDRQDQLLKRPKKVAVAVSNGQAGVVREAAPAPLTVWQRLEDLLGATDDPRELADGAKKQAFNWYRGLSDQELTRLSAPALLRLARLVDLSGLTSRALDVYDLLLRTHRDAPQAAKGAGEAAALAERERRPMDVQYFRSWKPSGEPASALATESVVEPAAEFAGNAPLVVHPVEEEPARPAPKLTPVPACSAASHTVTRAAPPLPPPEPRATWGEMFARFMEERNILWGELVGGMLIVGCSIALVISLWQTLEQIPYFPFLLFTAITGALFGAGLYTLGHWKLEATSRGLLVIAVLMAPLDFLVLARVTQNSMMPALDWIVQLIAAAGFAWIVLRSLRTLIVASATGELQHIASLTTVAVIGAAASQLFVPYWLDLETPHVGLFVLLSLTPVLFHALTHGWVLSRLTRRDTVSGGACNVVLVTLGMTTFAALVALGFIVHWSPDRGWAVRHLAAPVALLGLPLAAGGALVWRRVNSAEGRSSRGLSARQCQVAGTFVALAGMLVMVVALALGWPRPSALISIGLLNAAVLLGVALLFRLPAAHVPALLCLTVGFLTAYHWAAGAIDLFEPDLGERLLELARSAPSAIALTALAALVSACSEWFARTQRRLDGLIHASAGGVLAVLALQLAAVHYLPAPWIAAVVFSVVGAGALAVNLRHRLPWLSVSAGLVLLGAAFFIVKPLAPDWRPGEIALLALLAHATALAPALATREGHWSHGAFGLPLRGLAMVSSAGATLALVLTATPETLAWTAALSFWLAALWLVFAWALVNHVWFALGQTMLAAGSLVALFAWMQGQEALARSLAFDVQASGLMLACLSLAWMLLRTGSDRLQPVAGGELSHDRLKPVTTSARLRALLRPEMWTVDEVMFFSVLVGQLVFAAVALIQPVARELSLAAPTAVPYAEALGWTTLLALAATLGLRLSAEQPNPAANAAGSRTGNSSRRVADAVLGWVVLAVSVAALSAFAAEAHGAVGDALRWGLALAYLGVSLLLWGRRPLASVAVRLNITASEDRDLPRQSRILLQILTVTPVLLLTTLVALQGFAGVRLAGPDAESWFASLGWVPRMIVPLAMVMLTFLGHGIRENSAGYIFAAGLVLFAVLPGGHALDLVTSGVGIDTSAAVMIGQLAAAAASLWLVGWLLARRWRSLPLLVCQWALGGAVHVLLLGSALAGLLIGLDGPPLAHVQPSGGVLGWIGGLAWIAGGIWLCNLSWRGGVVHVLGLGGLGLGILAACVTLAFDPAGWHSYHALTLSWTLTALTLLTLAWTAAAARGIGPLTWDVERRASVVAWLRQRIPEFSARRWVETLSILVVLLALGGAWGDPAAPYGSCIAISAISVLWGALAVWTRRPGYVYASGLLLNLAAYVIWQHWLVDFWNVRVWFLGQPEIFDIFLLGQVLALALGSGVWSMVETALRRREPPIDVRGRVIPYVHAAALLGLQLLAVYILVGVGSDIIGGDMHLRLPVAWLALGAVTAALALAFWDPEAKHWGVPGAPLYVIGLLAIGLALHGAQLSPRDLGWWAALALGGYALATTLLVRLRLPLDRWLDWAPQAESRWTTWLLPLQAVTGLGAVALGLGVVGVFPTTLDRGAAVLTVLLVTGAFALLVARGDELWSRRDAAAPGAVSSWLIAQTLLLLVLLACTFGWAFVDPVGPAPWLQRSAGLLSVLALAAPLYGLLLPRRLDIGTRWAAAARQLGKPLTWGLIAALILFFGQQFVLYNPEQAVRSTPLVMGWKLAVAGLLFAYTVAAVVIAVAPRFDPFDLTDRGRVMSVWLAELFLGLTFLHLRLNVPDLLPSFVGKYWAFILMTLGFLGVGFGELFRRRDLPMLAEPLFRTGLALPLVPMIGYMLKPLADLEPLRAALPGLDPLLRYLDRLDPHFGVHAGLWFLLALLYGYTAVLRGSSWFGLLAALVANFGLWVIYAQHPDLALALHPQLWLAPLGVLVLVTDRLHGDKLQPTQSQALRYFGLLLIYVSSSADLFIAGLGNSVVLPVVLALLCIGGVLAGIMLRVRAFLLAGIAFLGLDIFSQIWHAAVNRQQTWIWWASGIVLGAMILALFALFEKRRNDVVRLLDDFRQWR